MTDTTPSQRARELLASITPSYRTSGMLFEHEALRLIDEALAQGRADERRALMERIQDAELALSIYDPGGDSEYWLRHPTPAAPSTSTGG